MRILVLGGTVFLGRHVVEAALARGDEVSLFNRGRHSPELFPEVEKLRGDREGDLSALAGRSWDAAVDTSGYFPRVVAASAEALAGRVGHYIFISTASVYRDFSHPGVDETAPTHEQPPDAPEELGSPEAYGGFKAACERVVEAAFPGRGLNVRAGLIVGPHDPTNRFTYWVTRIARGGEVLAPEPREHAVQFVDVRDLAEWILSSAERGQAGTFNAMGEPLPFVSFLAQVRAATASNARLTWVDERFLLDAGLEPFQDVPLWLAPSHDPTYAHFLERDASRAVAAGLRFRPLAETVRDTLAWARAAEPARGLELGVGLPAAGLAPERERELLDAWRRRAA